VFSSESLLGVRRPVIKVLVLGGGGMLGSELNFVGASFPELEVSTTLRSPKVRSPGVDSFVKISQLDFSSQNLELVSKLVSGQDYVINAIGVIPQKSEPIGSQNIAMMYEGNVLLPLYLDYLSGILDFRFIQIGTDCVFSGSRGDYRESSPLDATDHYGMSKILSESNLKNSQLLRCSIVGKERESSVSLLGWFLSLPRQAKIRGYTNHLWNGLTTYHFSKILFGIIRENLFEPGIHHLVPQDTTTKYDLLKRFSAEFERTDVEIEEICHETSINRILSTDYLEKNSKYWQCGGFNDVRSISQMLNEYRQRLEGREKKS
jgi:dTDP-4-dehydrorhamnose reductase